MAFLAVPLAYFRPSPTPNNGAALKPTYHRWPLDDCRAADLDRWERREGAWRQRPDDGSNRKPPFDGWGKFRFLDAAMRHGVMQWQHFGRCGAHNYSAAVRLFVTGIEICCFFLVLRSTVRVVLIEFFHLRVVVPGFYSLFHALPEMTRTGKWAAGFDGSAVLLLLLHCVVAVDLLLVRLSCTRERGRSWTEPFTDALAWGSEITAAAAGFLARCWKNAVASFFCEQRKRERQLCEDKQTD